MKLQQNIASADFLEKVRCCEGEVLFQSDEGDILNLKSQLSQYIFITIVHRKDFSMKGSVECKNKEDYKILAEYLE